jgi:hypothetical protein
MGSDPVLSIHGEKGFYIAILATWKCGYKNIRRNFVTGNVVNNECSLSCPVYLHNFTRFTLDCLWQNKNTAKKNAKRLLLTTWSTANAFPVQLGSWDILADLNLTLGSKSWPLKKRNIVGQEDHYLSR